MKHQTNHENILEINTLAYGIARQANFDQKSNRFTGVWELRNHTSVEENPKMNTFFNPLAGDDVAIEILKSYGLVATSTGVSFEHLTISLSSESKEEFVRNSIQSFDFIEVVREFVQDNKDELFVDEELTALNVLDDYGLYDEVRTLEHELKASWVSNNFDNCNEFIETFVCDTEKFKTFVARSKDDDFESWLFDIEFEVYLKETYL